MTGDPLSYTPKKHRYKNCGKHAVNFAACFLFSLAK